MIDLLIYMSGEREKGKNIIKRIIGENISFSRRDITGSGIVPLAPEQKKEYPHLIYQLESRFPQDHALMLASFQAMKDENYPLVVDIEKSKTGTKAIVRTSTAERRDQTAESALFLGLTEATRRKIEAPPDEKGAITISDINQYKDEATTIAKDLLHGLISKPEMLKSFNEFYCGLRWNTDQEKLVSALFVHGTDFDPDFIQKHLDSRHLHRASYELTPDLPYEEKMEWDKAPIDDLLQRYPELDYRLLEDGEFRGSEQGQRMLKAFTKLGGEIKASQYKKTGIDMSITKEGKVIPRPLIPLSRHPIIEALVVDELSLDRPKPDYFFGAFDFTEIALDSDSLPVHNALVTSIITRLPIEQGRVGDVPNEFKHKYFKIRTIIRAYQDESRDKKSHEIIKQDLLKIMEAYTREGEITESVRADNEEYNEGARKGGYQVHETSDVRIVKDIQRDLIITGITSPDPELVDKAEKLID